MLFFVLVGYKFFFKVFVHFFFSKSVAVLGILTAVVFAIKDAV